MKRLTAIFFLSVIMILMCLVPVSFVAEQKDKTAKKEKQAAERTINWKELYPFSDEEAHTADRPQVVNAVYQFIKNKLEDYTSRFMIGNANGIYIAKKYEDLIGWNIASAYEYNGVIILPDGYLSGYIRPEDVSAAAASVAELKDYCASKSIDLFYVNAPQKICISDDKDISGVLDFSNQNADKLLELLHKYGVNAYDLREMLHEDGLNHHEAFYMTDHHWKVETGLWAAKHILQILRDNYGWSVEPEILNPENFEHVLYPEWFLGSQGKKLMLARTKPDDFTFIYPKHETIFHCVIPSIGLDKTGDFTVMCDMSQVVPKDYYNKSPYHAYCYGEHPLMSVTNLLADNDKYILIVRDSFSDAVIPFVAMGVRHVDAIDMRGMNGSLQRFIDVNKPDLVIVMYNEDSIVGTITSILRDGHFHFR